MNNQKSSRLPEYDLLRILAAFLVVMLHISGSRFHWVRYDTGDWTIMNIWSSFTRCSVPLFFMLSGAFMLKKEIPMKKLFLHKILPLATIYVFWSLFYGAVTAGFGPWQAVLKAAVTSHFHLWFLPTMMALYLLQPILYAFVHFENGRFIKYYLLLFLAFGILKPTILQFVGGSEILTMLTQKIAPELMGFGGYMLLGYYLANQKRLKLHPLWALAGYLVSGGMIALVGQLHAHRYEMNSTILYGNFALPVFLGAVFLFLLFQNLPLKEGGFFTRGWVARLSGLTMGIYVMHPYFIDLLTERGITILILNPMLSIPLFSLGLFALTALLSWILSKIPLIKYLIKG